MSSPVKLQIAKEELQSERIATIAQLVFVAAIFAIYHFSPKGFGNVEQSFEPVRIWFYCYSPILLLRLALLSVRRTSNCLLIAFIILDIAALSLLIFSFHIQYSQPVTLSLRAPTFVYLFVFLAIRCLSYDPIKILVAGITAGIGWVALLVYSLGQPNIFVTSRFSDYLQPNSVIIGTEVEKIIAILITSICLAGAVFRKRVLLERFSLNTVRASAMERLIGKESLDSFAPELSEIKPGFGVRRKAATMMVDLGGFSKLTYQLSTDDVLRYLAEYQAIVAQAIFAKGGSIDKYLGDGVLAHFGAVTNQSNFARASLEAAEEIQARLLEWSENLKRRDVHIGFGVAVTVGDVVFGVIGHDERMEITVLGEAVNLSAKLEKHTKRSGYRSLTTKKTFETARTQGFSPRVRWTELPASQIDGIPHTIDLIGFSDVAPINS